MKKDAHKGAPLIAAFLIMMVIALPAHVLATNWTVYKNSPKHTGVASDALEPPLVLLWKLAMEEGVTLGEEAVIKANIIVHQITMGR
ncbi:hypothetical protein [Thermococcus sp. 21S7]|uniref:hypothetical protein n=1 Tax=Thermococcus sp. 21S7 TaxID=1638221 RepID=UPI001439356E|nr:hypothetical protein [Thermococcus sp. 21S7]NJE60192.1 hypothetical protein [Thermococcus sp. 21S7]